MTKIHMDWKRLELTAEGHAGGGPKGQDIICAGISALAMALLNQLIEDCDECTVWSENPTEGKIQIRTEPPAGAEDRIRDYFRVIMTGMKAWEQAFPENISIEEVNEDGAD